MTTYKNRNRNRLKSCAYEKVSNAVIAGCLQNQSRFPIREPFCNLFKVASCQPEMTLQHFGDFVFRVPLLEASSTSGMLRRLWERKMSESSPEEERLENRPLAPDHLRKVGTSPHLPISKLVPHSHLNGQPPNVSQYTRRLKVTSPRTESYSPRTKLRTFPADPHLPLPQRKYVTFLTFNFKFLVKHTKGSGRRPFAITSTSF